MKIVVLEQSGWVHVLDNSLVSCSFLVLLAASPGPAGPCCAQQKWFFTAVFLNCSHNCCCRDDAFHKRSLEDGPLEGVILLSDSTDATEAGDRRKSVGFCQCGGNTRSSQRVPKGTDKRVQQVLVQVLVHVCGNAVVRVILLETSKK